MPDPRNTRRPLEPAPHELRLLIDACAEFVVEQIETLPSQPSWDLDGAESIAAGFAEPPPDDGRAIASILERLRPAVAKSLNAAGPGYLAYIPGGGIPSAALADFVALAVNRFVGIAGPAPALARIEAQAIGWLATLMGYPPDAGGILKG